MVDEGSCTGRSCRPRILAPEQVEVGQGRWLRQGIQRGRRGRRWHWADAEPARASEEEVVEAPKAESASGDREQERRQSVARAAGKERGWTTRAFRRSTRS